MFYTSQVVIAGFLNYQQYISQPEPIKSCLVLNAQSGWEQNGLEQTE